jgi:8-oxo-dGTP diphosphatase
VSDRFYPDRPYVGIGAVIVVDGKVVLIKRGHEPLAGRWSLPGGAVELGETVQEAVAREMLEETGLAVRVGPPIEVFDRIMRDDDGRVRYHFVLIDYLCWRIGGELRAGSDVADAVVAGVHELEAFELSGLTTSVIQRGLAMTNAR